MAISFAFRSILHSAPPFPVPWKARLSRIHHLGSLALWLLSGSATGRQHPGDRRVEGERSDPSPLGLVSGHGRVLL